MNDGDERRPELAEATLPEQPVRALMEPFARFLQIETASGLILIVAIVVALAVANSPGAHAFLGFWQTPLAIRLGSHQIGLTLRDGINEGLMTLFFFVVGLEIKRELVLGELRDPAVAALPVSAALGGMAVPAVIYLALQWGTPAARDWGVVMATDIALVVGAMALLGERVPHSLRIFVLSLAIIDDIGAVLVIVVLYSGHIAPAFLVLACAGLGAAFVMQRLGVRSIPLYWLVGIVAWFGLHESGVHATLVGIALGLMTPARPWVGSQRFAAILRRARSGIADRQYRPRDEAEEERTEFFDVVARAAREVDSPLERLERLLHPWVSFAIVPLFALANAGVPMSFSELRDPTVVAVFAGLVVGKPVGIFGTSWIAVRAGIARRDSALSWSRIAAAGVLCSVGFTMALFIANLAFGPGLLVAASVGVIAASFVGGILGLGLLAAALRRSAAPARVPTSAV